MKLKNSNGQIIDLCWDYCKRCKKETQHYSRVKKCRVCVIEWHRKRARLQTPRIRKRKLEYYRQYYDMRQKSRNKLREEVFRHYSTNHIIRCKTCNIRNQEVLVLDHIHNDGSAMRRRFKSKMTGSSFYQWIRNNKFPSGLQVLCHNCNWLKQKALYAKQREKTRNEAIVPTSFVPRMSRRVPKYESEIVRAIIS